MLTEIVNQPKPRLKYIDIAKGILICCLLWGHMMLFARMAGLSDPVMDIIQKSINLYSGFFMQTFFVITGFCSSFNKRFSVFLWGNVKSLLIPAVILVVISNYVQELTDGILDIQPFLDLLKWFALGGPWFIMALFWGKLLLWFIIKFPFRRQIIVLVCIYLTGLALNIVDMMPNYLYHRHVLLMLPYLFVGQYCKKHKEKMTKWLPYVAAFGIISITAQFVFSQFVSFYIIPTHDYYIGINKTFPVHIVNSISGTAAVCWISQKISNNHYLETLGKGTLLIYLWNGIVNKSILRLIPYPNGENILLQIVFHFAIYLLMLGIFYLLVRIVYESKYLRWIVGKW